MLSALRKIKYSSFVSSIILWLRVKKSNHIKLNVGSANSANEGWIPSEINSLNIVKKKHWSKYFKESSITCIFSEHVWEHLTIEEGNIAIQNCFHFLIHGGNLRIAVPDGLHPDPKYIEYVKVGGTGAGSDDHKVLFNYKILTQILKKAGFEITLLEYYDENQKFHFFEWSNTHGQVKRSSRYDNRNKNGKLNYTSLIIDAKKP